MPGPRPHYQPRFSEEERQQAEGVANQRRVAEAVQWRARLALLLSDEPHISNPEAGRRLGIHENTVRHWRQRWTREGLVLHDRPRPGRPRKTATVTRAPTDNQPSG